MIDVNDLRVGLDVFTNNCGCDDHGEIVELTDNLVFLLDENDEVITFTRTSFCENYSIAEQPEVSGFEEGKTYYTCHVASNKVVSVVWRNTDYQKTLIDRKLVFKTEQEARDRLDIINNLLQG